MMRLAPLILILLFLLNNPSLGQTEAEIQQDLLELTNRVERYGSAESYLVRGMALYKLGRLEDAHKDFEEACELEPDNDITWYWLGCSNFASTNFTDAAWCFSKSVSLDSEAPWFYHQALGDALYQDGKHLEALACYQNGIEAARSRTQSKERVRKLEEVLNLARKGVYRPELPEPIDRI